MFIPGIFEGIRPENKDNPKEFIFNPPKFNNFDNSPLTNRNVLLGYDETPKKDRVNMFTPANSSGNGRGVEPCETGTEKYFRSALVNPMNGLQVNTGYARGQAKGLAYNGVDYPLTNPIMPPTKLYS
jgi:hypothetical protein